MADIRLVTGGKRELRPLVQAALSNELRLIEAGIRQAERRLQEYEKRYRMSSQEFISDYENSEKNDTLDFAEWIGEYRLLDRLKEKAETLRDIRIEN